MYKRIALLILVAAAVAIPAAAAAPLKWVAVTSPNSSAANNSLDGVACGSASFCVAVGSSTDANLGARQTLVETSNGSTWSLTPSPSPGGSDNALLGVSCTSATFCVAVGFFETANFQPYQALIESWDGTSWSVVPTASTSTSYVLDSVSCLSSTSCVAAGYYDPGDGSEHPLVEQWDGSAWSVVPTPNPSAPDNFLDGIACVSASFCVAVGESDSFSAPIATTLIEQWNGTSWSIVPSVNVGSGVNGLHGVGCLSTTSCYAVGVASGHTLVEAWNGTSWSLATSANASSNLNFLNGVVCTIPHHNPECEAVGAYQVAPNGGYNTLVLTLKRDSWNVESSESPGGLDFLGGVASFPGGPTFAVGSSAQGGFDHTLILKPR